MNPFPVRAFSTLCLLLLMTACSILPKSEPVAAYRLPPMVSGGQGVSIQSTAASDDVHGHSLRIVTPNGSRILDSDRILVLPENNLVQFYANARWTDPAPVLLRNRLLQAFLADGRIPYLSSDDSSVMADQELIGDLISFQSEYHDGKPIVVIRFSASLIDQASRRIVAIQTFEVQQAAVGVQLEEVVTAFGQASDALATQVIGWVIAQPRVNMKR
ncbi:cholesterol transport system auxiliary component [Herbaspirillum sp. Sphag1AN]|uniref:ABC-type transport auxiliary lipoprotein family protein n=1 Tax=unclassified Herbaspirillum TaxID=2624150 RepID=UPI001618D0F2|nr:MULTISPECIES: ABC-type transport auxiliary lipoprotein family protein [unclassified Herbaspirillum]MBB3213394.1 cholesterol transport system auxiliary component [Herbaspirillum sp. Sphag1AN]MBB3246562.1 cholesterol transport system auxiliary component [Herbaspirillum sp. Sphag64]